MTNVAPAWGRVMEAVAREVLGEPSTSTTHELRYGTRGSLVVNVGGPRAGQWKSWETAASGGVIDFLQYHLNLDRQAALRWLQDRNLVDSGPSNRRTTRPQSSGKPRSSQQPSTKELKHERAPPGLCPETMGIIRTDTHITGPSRPQMVGKPEAVEA